MPLKNPTLDYDPNKQGTTAQRLQELKGFLEAMNRFNGLQLNGLGSRSREKLFTGIAAIEESVAAEERALTKTRELLDEIAHKAWNVSQHVQAKSDDITKYVMAEMDELRRLAVAANEASHGHSAKDTPDAQDIRATRDIPERRHNDGGL